MRQGSPCRSLAVAGKRRWRVHGSTRGSGARPGNRNALKALKHGRHARELLEFCRRMAELVREAPELVEIAWAGCVDGRRRATQNVGGMQVTCLEISR